MQMVKILFVEDEPNHIMIYKTKLQQEGFDFMAAKTGEEAIPMIKVEKPDLILLDILLPGEKNGLDVLAQLKAEPATKKIPIIVFTNYDEKEFREQASDLGANAFVLKANVTPSEMVKKIREILAQKK
jgi:CheY-like chemotaxis protein